MSKLLVIIFILALAPSLASGQWSEDPAVNTQITNLPGEDVIPKVGIGPDGDYFIGYFSLEQDNYNVRLQRLDKDGNIMWADDGIIISDHPSMSWLTDWDLTVDHDNHAILTWQDIRSGGQNNVVAYRISPDGDLVWGADGIMLSNSDNFDVAPVVTVTTDNHSVIAWQSEGVIIMQRIAPDGTKQWGEWGIIFSGDNNHSWPQLMPAGNDDVIMKFFEDSGPFWAPDRFLKAQRFNGNGDAVWASPAVICDHGSITAWTQILSFKPDDNDGFYIAWHDYQLSNTQASAWLQHVNESGQIQFQANGVLLSNQVENNQFHPVLAKSDNDQNIYVFWTETDGDQFFFGVSGQKVSPSGSLLWSEGGKEIIPLGTPSISVHEVAATGPDVIIMYDQSTSGVNYNLHAMLVDSHGSFVWDTQSKPISTVNSTKTHTDVSDYANGQWVLSWSGNRTASTNIFAQNIQPDGTLGVVETSGSISGHVEIEGEMADVTEVTVTLGEHQTHPDASGFYQIDELPAGTYDVTAHHPYTETQLVENIVIEGGALTENVDFMLNMLRRDLHLMVVDADGDSYASVDFLIEGPEGSYAENSGEDEYIYVLPSLPYGFYEGTATLLDGFVVLQTEMVLDADNDEMVFLFLEAGMLEASLFADMMVYPNPLKPESVLMVNSSVPGTFTIQVVSFAGKRVVAGHTIHLFDGPNKLPLSDILPSGKMQAGVYILHLTDGNKSRSIQFVIDK